jgi:hypothetical protein
MAGTYDSEQLRISDRIKCIAFREARDTGATFINRQWIAEKTHRSTRFVTEWWENHTMIVSLFISSVVEN